jgi:hypothetical protein
LYSSGVLEVVRISWRSLIKLLFTVQRPPYPFINPPLLLRPLPFQKERMFGILCVVRLFLVAFPAVASNYFRLPGQVEGEKE